MRDPDLVNRAERAATALEQAWLQWRVRHGIGTGTPQPVSSYVGYSLEEPWGQPRVVLGLGADEAERLAAILEGHDYAGPVYAGVRDRLERRQPESAPDAAPAWTVPGSRLAEPESGAAPAEPDQHEHPATAPEELTAEQPVLPLALRRAAATADQPAELTHDDAAYLQALAAQSAARPSMSRAFPADQVLPAAGPAPAAAAVGRPGIVALRPRPGDQESQRLDTAAPDADDPQQRPDAEPAESTAESDDSHAEQVSRTRLHPVSGQNRARKNGGTAAETGTSASWPKSSPPQPAAADTAV